MDKITLEVTEGRYSTVKEARAAGRVPMAYYGKGVKNRGFSADYQDFRRAYTKGGRSAIIYFMNEKNEEFPILVQEVQRDPVSDRIIHADILAVDLNKLIRTEIPIVLTGVAPAVKELGGILVQNKNSVGVECLPKDLVHQIEADVSLLVDFNTSVTVGDLKPPSAIKILDAPDINVAVVSAPHALVEEEKPAVAPAEGADAEDKTGAAKQEEKAEGGKGKE